MPKRMGPESGYRVSTVSTSPRSRATKAVTCGGRGAGGETAGAPTTARTAAARRTAARVPPRRSGAAPWTRELAADPAEPRLPAAAVLPPGLHLADHAAYDV